MIHNYVYLYPKISGFIKNPPSLLKKSLDKIDFNPESVNISSMPCGGCFVSAEANSNVLGYENGPIKTTEDGVLALFGLPKIFCL